MNISPNVNFNNPSFIMSYKEKFKPTYNQIHLSSVSSDAGKSFTNRHIPTLIGVAAIVTFDQWASKVCSISVDPCRQGTCTSTTYKGKNGRHLTLICAYISVKKGAHVGDNTLYNQQITLMELQAIKENKVWDKPKCPRKEAIKELSKLIHELQEQVYSILLAIDANQSPQECYKGNLLQKDTIKWLQQEHGLSDPFVEMFQTRLSSTTIHPNRYIDFIITHNIATTGITLLTLDSPATTDHFGICIDIDIAQLFISTYSDLASLPTRRLTVGNTKAKKEYKKLATKIFIEACYWEQSNELLQKASRSHFSDADDDLFNQLDDEITHTILNSELQCSN
jgi:hypothetical protein